MSKDEARKALGCTSDYQLAKALGVSHQAVYAWAQLPQQRVWQIRAMLAESHKETA